jgi:methylated-DNA-[protein]-cysteine S-methyltransferase
MLKWINPCISKNLTRRCDDMLMSEQINDYATLPFLNGTIIIIGNQNIVKEIKYTDERLDLIIGSGEIKKAREQLEEYRDLKRQQFNFKYHIQGTVFQQAVYQELLKVPFGSYISYQQLGEQAGYKKAARAVGQAMSVNPLMIVVPCHRVIAANNKLGGFTGGLALKKALLNHEHILKESWK